MIEFIFAPNASPAPGTRVVAVADLLSGSQGLYTLGVAVLAILFLLAGGARGLAAFGGGRIGSAIGWVAAGIICAVIIGSAYAIYTSTKQTVDHHTGITSGQFG
ncbi:glycosyl transferase family 39 [Mycolicibacterium septicum]|uniref:glycosyl transferase family 39 n=1 Tax=Mycolicibacterium septicum TaxID=98668 RepID=UPI00235F88E0|nr:glycosyl transferase family 39 [Mycolicibacterium septicum]